MDNDKFGRWARVAWVGKFNAMGFYRNKVCRWQAAWISKKTIAKVKYFYVQYSFPNNGDVLFSDLIGAKKEVEKQFNWFNKMVNS